ncbi:MAG: AAA family ATPase [Candidatus Syntrophoarchaeum sp.]|nr:AAA family ATPase [Candidatus Syntrophoarchaeum sp.]
MTKQRIHTTIDAEAYHILQKYEEQWGGKNAVLEAALKGLDQGHKAQLDIKIYEKIGRKSTGIPTLDQMIEGGIPKNFVVIVTGTPGTGKTTFGMQFLVEGIKNGERGIFFSFEEDSEQLANHCLRFGWNLREYAEKGQLLIYGLSMITVNDVIEVVQDYKPSRIVIDSINLLTDFGSSNKLRENSMLRNLLKLLKRERVTTIITTEKTHGLEKKAFDQFDFMGDGLIFLDRTTVNDMDVFLIKVQKMRGTKINGQTKVFEMTDQGIVVSLDFSPGIFDIK